MVTVKFHPLADIFPLMEGAEFEELVADIRARGLREKIDLYEGKIVDGRNRYRALQQLGIDPDAKYFRKTIYAHSVGGEIAPHEGNNDDRVRAYVISKNIHRRHLTQDQKRDLIAKLVKATPEKSDRQIAQTVKASPTTVGTVRAEMEATREVSKLDTRTDAKGVKQPAKKKRKPGIRHMVEDESGTFRLVSKAVAEHQKQFEAEEPEEKQELPAAARIRGFIYRAEEALRGANEDDMIGIKITAEMCKAADEAARAWATLSASLRRMRNQRPRRKAS